MKPCFIIFMAAVTSTIGARPAWAQPQIEETPPLKVGQIFVVGNDVTMDRVILKTMGLSPGQPFRDADLKAAAEKLKRLGIFDTKSPPSVEALDSYDDPGFTDILVRIKETQTGSFVVGAGLQANGRIMVRFELVERNLDYWKFPTSLADIHEGRAFRGAGNTLSMKLVLR